MQFIIKAYDGEGKVEKRMAARPAHLENMAGIRSKVVCAGGLLDEDGAMKGSVLIMDFENREELDDYLANEPYIKEGVWEKVEAESMNVVIVNGERVEK